MEWRLRRPLPSGMFVPAGMFVTLVSVVMFLHWARKKNESQMENYKIVLLKLTTKQLLK